MKIKRAPDGSLPLTGFGPPVAAAPQPGAVAVDTSVPAPPPATSDAAATQAHVHKRVFATTAPATAASKLPDKPAPEDTEVYNKQGEKLPKWPCPLCLLVGRVESANTHPLQRCHANP